MHTGKVLQSAFTSTRPEGLSTCPKIWRAVDLHQDACPTSLQRIQPCNLQKPVLRSSCQGPHLLYQDSSLLFCGSFKFDHKSPPAMNSVTSRMPSSLTQTPKSLTMFSERSLFKTATCITELAGAFICTRDNVPLPWCRLHCNLTQDQADGKFSSSRAWLTV